MKLCAIILRIHDPYQICIILLFNDGQSMFQSLRKTLVYFSLKVFQARGQVFEKKVTMN